MSLMLISQSYLVESGSEFGFEEDEVEEDEKLVKSSERIVKSYMKSKWDSDDDGTGFNEKSYYSSPNVEPEHQLLTNPSAENLPTSNIPEDILDLTPPEAGSITQIEKQLPISVNQSPLFEVSLGEITDIPRRPHRSRRPQKNKKGNISRSSPRQLKRSSFKTAKLEVQTLYKCPYCLHIFAVAEDLIQHLQSHARKYSSISNTGRTDSYKSSIETREKLRKNSLKLSKDILRPCQIKLNRCDQLIAEGKPLTTNTDVVSTSGFNKNDLSEIQGGTNSKRRSAGINTRRKMLKIQMQDEYDNENGEHVDPLVTDGVLNQRRNDFEPKELSETGTSKLRPPVADQQNSSFNISKHPQVKGKSYKCPTCSKCFVGAVKLKIHIRIHTGEKPHKCPTCSKGFAQSTTLKRHIRTHTGEKPYKCSTCSKGFIASTDLKRHIRTHTGEKPHKCPTCSIGFAQLTTLKRHIRTHTGEKPYKCTICAKGFAQPTDLRRHIRTHTGKRPYKCPICCKGFSHSNTLKRHIIRTHTGEKSFGGKCPTSPKNIP